MRVREAARLLGVSPNTLRRAEDAGAVPCVRSPGGHRRYRRRDLEEILANGGLRRQASQSTTSEARQARDATGELVRQVADLSTKVKLAQEINSLLAAGPSRLLGAIARRLAQLSGCPICTIYAVEGERLRVLVSFEDGAFDEAWAGRLCEPSFWPPAVEALRRQEPCVIVDSSDPAVPATTRAVMKEWACSATLTIPLIIEGSTIGLVELSDHATHDFGDELELACDLAQTAAHAIQNARLLQRVEQTNAVLAALVDLGAFIAQTHDLEAVAGAVTKRLREVIGVTYCEMYVIEDERLRLVGGHDEAPYGDRWFGWSDDLSRYPACAAAIASGDILVVASPDDPRLTGFEQVEFREFNVASEVAVPLIVGEHAVGLIDLFDERPRDYADYVDFLRSVGQMVAGHMQNALLFTEVERHNAMLRELVEIGALASRSRDVGALVQTLVERLMATVDADLCEIYAIEKGRLRLLAGCDRAGYGDEWDGWTDELAHYPTTAAAVAALDVLVVEGLDDPRLSEFERERMAEFGLVSEICVPLVVDDRAVGTIDVFATKARDFHESLGFLRSVAPVLAGAIDGALLVDRLRASTRDLQMLVDSSLDFGSSLELDDVLATIAARMATVSGARWCDIYAIEGDDVRGLLSYERDHRWRGSRAASTRGES